MCVTAVGRVLEVQGNHAVVEIQGKRERVRIDLVPATVGDYLYCAAGMAIEKAEGWK
ncbi:MAG: HypC/HybG/HupF family hydrogenase formation chaperone [Candidatus Aenigmarchaeota archaeon]|nr:HypC/HybG/HupF family hydrogenase formation chaperone [Candidatus Aenigmarchaeota archaeon]